MLGLADADLAAEACAASGKAGEHIKAAAANAAVAERMRRAQKRRATFMIPPGFTILGRTLRACFLASNCRGVSLDCFPANNYSIRL
jgi:hypothetical protein